MKTKSLFRAIIVGVVLGVVPAGGATATGQSSVRAELAAIQREIATKVQRGARGERAFAAELNRLELLAAQHWDEKTDDVAEILTAQAELEGGPMARPELAEATLQRLKFSFPDTAAAARVDGLIAAYAQQTRAPDVAAGSRNAAGDHSASTGLAIGQRFPGFDGDGLDGTPVLLAEFQGQVVLIDFWATWCGPCVAEIPAVLRAYENHRDSGFAVIGISLDRDRGALERFVQQRSVPWPQLSGTAAENLARRCAIRSIPATFLLDRHGIVLARNLRGAALERAVANAVAE